MFVSLNDFTFWASLGATNVLDIKFLVVDGLRIWIVSTKVIINITGAQADAGGPGPLTSSRLARLAAPECLAWRRPWWPVTVHTTHCPGARTYPAVFRSISNMKTSIIFPPTTLFCWKCLKFWSWACGGPGQSGAGGRSQPGRAPWLGQARAQLRSPTNSVRNRAVNFCTHKYLPWYKQKYLAELTVLTIFCDCDVN